MAQLPVYRQQGNITTETPGAIRNLDAFSQGSQGMQKAGNALMELAAQWQTSKDAVENLNGKNKLNSDISAILDEAANYNDYSTPDELQQKQDELTQRMNNIVPDVVGGFSNNMNAREFEAQGQFAVQQNIYKLQEIFRNKYGDMYEADRMAIQDRCFENYAKTGNEGFKQEYFNAIDTGVQAGYLDRAQAQKLKLQTDEWNYSYAYSQILDNPYAKITEETLSKIDPVKQRTLRNFQRAEIKRAEREAEQEALFDFQNNPTQQNYARLCKRNPKYKGIKSFQKQTETAINPNAVTNLEDYQSFTNAILNISKPQTEEEKKIKNKEDLVLTKSVLLYTELNKAQQDGRINPKEAEKLSKLLQNAAKNNVIMDAINQMPNLELEYFKSTTKQNNKPIGMLDGLKQLPQVQAYRGVINTAKALMARSDIDNIAKNTTSLVIDNLTKGDVKAAQQAYRQGMTDITKKKYWYIPAVQNPNLKIGDQFVLNGKVMQFNGFTGDGKDIIVNTGKPKPAEMRSK